MTIDTGLLLTETVAVLYLVYLERLVLEVERKNLSAFQMYFEARIAWYKKRSEKKEAKVEVKNEL
jgi:hypothetical protein